MTGFFLRVVYSSDYIEPMQNIRFRSLHDVAERISWNSHARGIKKGIIRWCLRYRWLICARLLKLCVSSLRSCCSEVWLFQRSGCSYFMFQACIFCHGIMYVSSAIKTSGLIFRKRVIRLLMYFSEGNVPTAKDVGDTEFMGRRHNAVFLGVTYPWGSNTLRDNKKRGDCPVFLFEIISFEIFFQTLALKMGFDGAACNQLFGHAAFFVYDNVSVVVERDAFFKVDRFCGFHIILFPSDHWSSVILLIIVCRKMTKNGVRSYCLMRPIVGSCRCSVGYRSGVKKLNSQFYKCGANGLGRGLIFDP